MARISGVDLPRNKRIDIGLTYVFGIGNTSANQIVTAANVSPSTRCNDLTDEEMSIMARCLPNELSNMSPLQKLGIGLKILVRKPVLLTKRVISVLLSFGYSRAKHFGW